MERQAGGGGRTERAAEYHTCRHQLCEHARIDETKDDAADLLFCQPTAGVVLIFKLPSPLIFSVRMCVFLVHAAFPDHFKGPYFLRTEEGNEA